MSKARRLVVFPSDPIYKYYKKGEIKPRYYNPCNFFDQVHFISLCNEEINAEKVQTIAGDAHIEIHPVGRPTPLTLPLYFGRITRLVHELKPDVIRAYNPWHTGALAIHAGRWLGVPSVLSLHTEHDAMRRYDRRLMVRFARLFEYYSISQADRVICVSNYLVPYARRYGARNITVIYNRVYVEQFEPNGPLAIPRTDGHPVILSVGRLDPQKYQECLIWAIQGLDARLVLIGDGGLRGYLEQLAYELGVSQQVQFIRSVPNQEIASYYWSADIFAMATHYEGFCIPVLEAMAAGLPVVACDTPPLPEVLGGTGLVVENTPGAFRETFVQLLAEPRLREALGAKARARAVELDGSIMEQKEAELYREVSGVL